MPRPTAAQLIEQLRQVHSPKEGERLSNENLAAKLPISLSTFNRWKKGDTASYDAIIAMLDQAGWLNISGDAHDAAETPVDPLASIAAAVVEIGETQKRILDRLPRAARANRKSVARVAPKQSREGSL